MPPAGSPVVLVHGGSHGAWCWEPMLPFLDGPVLAVDLPPKRLRTGEVRLRSWAPNSDEATELRALKVSDLADSIMADVDAAGFDHFVLVGHSMAGIAIPEVARRIPDRVLHLVFVSALVPPEGGSVTDTLHQELVDVFGESAKRFDAVDEAAGVLDEAMARFMFCNDMDEEQARWVLDRLCPEGTNLLGEAVSRLGVSPTLPKTYVRLSRDQVLPPDMQTEMIANLEASPGGEVAVVEIDSGRDAMVSHPRELAAVVNRIAAG